MARTRDKIRNNALNLDSNSEISRLSTQTLAVKLSGCLLMDSCSGLMKLARSLTVDEWFFKLFVF